MYHKLSRLQRLFYGFLATYSLSLHAEEPHKISNVVISSTAFEHDADTNVRQVIVIKGEDLAKKGYTSLEQALERIPGVSFVDSGLGRNIDMRGQGDKANVAVKVLVDGKAINVLDNSHGITPLESINLENIQRIEIIPGGGAVLYGSGTRGGVINIITKHNKQNLLSLSLKGTSFDSGNLGGNVHANITRQLTDFLSLSANLHGFNRDGYQEGSNEKGFFANSKAYVNVGDKTSITLGYNFFKNKKASTGYLTKEQIDADPTQRGPDTILQDIKRPEARLDITHYFNSQWKLNTNAFWQNQKIQYLNNTQIVTMRGVTIPVDQSGSQFEDTRLGVQLKTEYNYAPHSYVVLGYDFEKHSANRQNLMTYSFNAGPANITHNMTTLMNMEKQSHSVFALDSHQLTEKFFISGGARYEYAQYTTDRYYRFDTGFAVPIPQTFTIKPQHTNNFALEITPNYKYSPTGSMYFKWEKGYISPTPAQFVSRDNTMGNPSYFLSNLDSETYHTFEIGLKEDWNHFAFNLNTFYTLSKDEITYAGDPHSATGAFWSYYNIDKTRRVGLELLLQQRFLNSQLVFKESLSFIDAKITKGINQGLRVPYVPKFKAAGSMEYTWTSAFQTFLDITYTGKAKDSGIINAGIITNMEDMKDALLVDLGALYHYKDLQLLAGVRNLFDTQYYTYQGYNIYESVASRVKKYSPAAGRSYYVEMQYVF